MTAQAPRRRGPGLVVGPAGTRLATARSAGPRHVSPTPPGVRIVSAMTTTPAETAAGALQAATTAVLLRTAYALTHRLHDAERQPADESVEKFLAVRDQIADLRAQRDLIDAELIRRAGA